MRKRRRTHEERTESEARVKQGRSTNEPRQTSNFILLSAYICKRSKIVFEQVGNRSRKSRTNREWTVRKSKSEVRTNSEKLNKQWTNNEGTKKNTKSICTINYTISIFKRNIHNAWCYTTLSIFYFGKSCNMVLILEKKVSVNVSVSVLYSQ